jgi:uncharacterized membrane protein YccC
VGNKIRISFFVAISFLAMLLSLAPFTPAILISFFMLLIAAIYGANGYLKSATLLLLINTLAVIGSPMIDVTNIASLILVLLVIILCFGCVIFGIRKLKGKCNKAIKKDV